MEMKLSPEFRWMIGAAYTVVLTVLATHLCPAGLIGTLTLLQIFTLSLIIVFWYCMETRWIKEVRDVRRALEKHLGVPTTPVETTNPSPGVVMIRCRHVQIRRVEDYDRKRSIHVSCEKRLMTAYGCPEPCQGYKEPPPPSGGGALAGMISGGTIGLIGGPVGVVVGGVIGALTGHTIEAASLEPRLEVELRRSREARKEPEVRVSA